MKRCTRPGLTLIELLVVIGLITVLALLTVWYVVPAFSDNKNVLRGTDRVVQTLLIARMRALRDQAPRGVRFTTDSKGLVSDLTYVEQPDPYRSGSVTISGNVATFTGANLLGSATPGDVENYAVQPGDWLQIGGSNNFEVASVDGPGQATLRRSSPVPLSSGTYKIIRQPRPIVGEERVLLPQNVVVNLGLIESDFPSYQVPLRTNTGVAIYEVLFDPSGVVINHPSGTPIVLWVQDATAESPADTNTTRLIAIYPRTGLIATHPLDRSGGPNGLLGYALDGKSSGM
jgi:prepilin-type N-terminal cleavage/methylation domain-containing protein